MQATLFLFHHLTQRHEDNDNDDIFVQPEDVTLELDEAFDELDKQLQNEKEHQLVADIDRGEVLARYGKKGVCYGLL